MIHNGKPIMAFCDNRGVLCLLRQHFSVARQARWASFLQQYNLSIEFVPGKDNVVADAFTHQYEQEEAVDPADEQLLLALDRDRSAEYHAIVEGVGYTVQGPGTSTCF